MKYLNFYGLMSSSKGRFLWLLLIIITLFLPIPYVYFISIFWSWLAVSYLGNRLNLKHKNIWRLATIPFSLLTYLIFLIANRKQLKSLTFKPQTAKKIRERLKIGYLFLINFIQVFLLSAGFFLLVYIFFFRPFQITDDAMYPNFQDKEYILTNIIVLNFENPKRGEVIVFKAPPDPEKDYIKRVIGIQGDKVSIKDGYVYLNGDKLNENKYLKPDILTHAGSFLKERTEVTVPADTYFVMGDNRSFSSDSREWGFVPRKSIIGKVWFCYFNCTRSLINYKAAENKWHHFTSTKDGFSIDFPNEPITKSDVYTYNAITIPYTIYDNYNKNKDEYMIALYHFPANVPLNNIESIKDAENSVLNTFINGFNGAIKYSNYSNFMGYETLEATSSGKYNGSDVKILTDIFIDNNKIVYLLTAVTYTKLEPDFAKFINSFSLNKQFKSEPSPSTEKQTTSGNITPNTYTGFLSGQNNDVDIKSLQDYVNNVQASKDSWQKGYATGRYSKQDLDKVIDEESRIISFSQTILTNLQSGNINTSSNISLWKAVLNMNDEVTALINKLIGQ